MVEASAARAAPRRLRLAMVGGGRGAFIGAVYVLRSMADADCSSWGRGENHDATWLGWTISGAWPSLNINKPCAMLKASWVFGIM